MNRQALHFVFWIFLKMHIVKQAGDCNYLVGILSAYSISREIGIDSMKVHFSINFHLKNFDYPEKPLKYKHIRRISD